MLSMALLVPGLAFAQQLSPAMIQQFMGLPQSQQLALAQQMGVDLGDIQAAAAGFAPNSAQSSVGQAAEPLQPRVEPDRTPPPQLAPIETSEPALTRYGLQLFDSDVSTFAPVDNTPVPSDYVIGPGDSFNIMLYGSENDNLNLPVDREGTINFPRLGPISLAGLTLTQAKEQIEARVAEQLIGVTAIVSAGRLRAINVFLAGEVSIPGSYSVSGLTTVTQALFVAGGVSDIGSLRNIQVRRNGVTVSTFDAYNLLLQGDSSGDVRLQSGDVVFVPPVQAMATIEGAVRRPAIYELIPGQTVNDLLQMAGRFTSNAFARMVTLERFNSDQALPELQNLDLTTSEGLQAALFDGDRLRVPVTATSFINGVQVKGAVVRPGNFAWHEGLRVSDLLPGVESHLNFDVDLNYALIVSIKNERLDIEVNTFDLGDAISNPGSDLDPILQPRDEILVFDLPEQAAADAQQIDQDAAAVGSLGNPQTAAGSLTQSSRRELLAPVIAKLRLQARENQPVQVVSVSGAVKAPGDYPLNAGDRLSVFLSAAGGLADNAYLNEAELQRVVVDENGRADIQISEINLTQRSENGDNNPILESRDHIYVRTIPDWTPGQRVKLAGEVRFPGTYLIGSSETLSSVIRRAGGLTAIGFAPGAVFTRESARELQRQEILDYADDIRQNIAVKSFTQEDQDLDVQQLDSLIEQLVSSAPQGRLVIDLPRALAGDPGADMLMQDGDTITIPRQSTSVSVIGEVRRSGVYSYQESFTLDDYLELSAGFTKRADEESVYVVKADGSVAIQTDSLFRFNSARDGLSPGDTIVVPVNNEYRDTIDYWATVTQIMYQVGISVAAVLAF